MRAILVSFVAALSAAATILCCASNDDLAATVGEPDAGTVDALASTDVVASDADLDAGSALDATDAGHCSPDHWCRVPLPTEDYDLAAVWSFAPDDALGVGSGGMIHWDGASWTVVSETDGGLDGLTSLWASGPNEVWAVGVGQRRLVHGTRASAASAFVWSVSERASGPSRDTITGGGPGDLWMSGIADDGTPRLEHGVVTTVGSPPTFATMTIGVAGFSPSGMLVTEGDELWLIGSTDTAMVAHAKKSGVSYVWDQSYSRAGQAFTSFNAIWGASANALFVIGGTTDNYHRSSLTDGGVVWGPVPNHANTSLVAAWGSGKDDVYAVGYLGAIRHWDGVKWSVSQLAVNGFPIYENLSAVHGSSASDVWAVGTGVALHRSVGAP